MQKGEAYEQKPLLLCTRLASLALFLVPLVLIAFLLTGTRLSWCWQLLGSALQQSAGCQGGTKTASVILQDWKLWTTKPKADP